MNKIIYYVACSIDGFICGEQEDINSFVAQGTGVQKYLDDLTSFETVIMGRKTYEFGYHFGLEPGAPPYPHMNHFIFSNTMVLEKAEDNVQVLQPDLFKIDQIKEQSNTDVYLCGGGIFAGWLLDNARIDVLKLKINPLVLGKGVKLFGHSKRDVQLNLLESAQYEEGLIINSYDIEY